jgi:hypothetical protein
MKYPVKVYEWRAHLLAHYSYEQLDVLRRLVEAEHINPRNARGCYEENGQETIHLYDRRGRKKLDALSWAVYHKQKAEKRNPLRCKDFKK